MAKVHFEQKVPFDKICENLKFVAVTICAAAFAADLDLQRAFPAKTLIFLEAGRRATLNMGEDHSLDFKQICTCQLRGDGADRAGIFTNSHSCGLSR